MAGWGGAEGPGTPIAEKEGTGCGRAIGVQGSGDPPPCVTSLPTAHFQATGRGRAEDVGCPGKSSCLLVGWCCLAWGRPGGSCRGGPPGPQKGRCLRLEGDPGQRPVCPQSPGFCCEHYCSADVGVPWAWSAANVIYGAVMGPGEEWGRTWGG